MRKNRGRIESEREGRERKKWENRDRILRESTEKKIEKLMRKSR